MKTKRKNKLMDGCVIAALAAAVAAPAFCAEWPVCRTFDGEHLLHVALPMGGIGCGAVSLSGRGELVDWEIMNRAVLSTSRRSGIAPGLRGKFYGAIFVFPKTQSCDLMVESGFVW